MIPTRTNQKRRGLTTSEGRRLGLSTLAAVAVAAAIALASPLAFAQTGGTTGTTLGTLTKDDVFIGIQRNKGENLTEVNRAKFLNNASCACKRPAWIKAVINTSALAKSSLVPGGDSVSMWLGTSCDQPTLLSYCHPLGMTVMSDFRANGMLVPTTVDVIATNYGINAGLTGTGGAGNTGGAGGAGGAGGTSSDSTPSSSSSGSSPCDGLGDMFSQTVWLFIESAPGLHDALSMSYGITIDAAPPPVPVAHDPGPANEALIATWTALDKTLTTDLAGYQIFCSRGNELQVFPTGTFTTYVDTCGNDPADVPLLPIKSSATGVIDRNTNFVCSDLLSVADTSFRLKILENGVNYTVGVAAVDSHGNASKVMPLSGKPIETTDFYHAYRNGDPQGATTGGCSVTGSTPSDAATAAGLMLLGLVGVRARRRDARARKDLP